ncbi:Kinetochore-associated protein 1 [Thoreauomyces humboldtii]|nr:Kinetochore-associated protein 1 [Thoreauomyces humboldtii]
MALEMDNDEMRKDGALDLFLDRIFADLKDVEDDAFCLEFCLRTVMPTFKATYRLLAFARTLSQNAAGNTNTTATPAIIDAVYQAIRRIGTYQLIAFERLNARGGQTAPGMQGEAIDAADGFCAREWQMLRMANMATQIRELLRDGDLRLAVVIWKRHYLDEGLLSHIHDIVSDIPEHASLDEFVPWLRMEVLPIVQQSADRTKLALWIDSRARLVEAREKRPQGALEVVRLLDKVALPGMSEPVGDGRVATSDQQLFTPATPAFYVKSAVLFAQTSGISTFGFESSSGKVWANGLKKQLEDLVYLWDKHDFCATLSDYSQLTLNDIAKNLLDRVAAPELLGEAIEKHFAPYVTKNGLNLEELLAEYCVDLMDGSVSAGAQKAAVNDSSWQARVLAILQCMEDLETKVDVVMELMKRTSVPWSEDVGDVFLETLRYPSSRRKDELREQYRLLKLKRMLVMYGIPSFNISDKTLAKALLPRILSRLEFPWAMKDAVQVVSAYHHLSKKEAYRLRLTNLLEAGLIDRAISLLQTGCEDPAADMPTADDDGLGLELDVHLDAIEQVGVGKEILNYLELVMQDAVEMQSIASLCDEAKKTFSWAIKAAVALCQAIVLIQDHLQGVQGGTNVPMSSSVGASVPAGAPTFTHRALLASALDPDFCGYENAKDKLQSLCALFEEFDVMMTLSDFAREPPRRAVLARFAKKVFKYVGNVATADLDSKRGRGKGKGKERLEAAVKNESTEGDSTHGALYRLAAVLGFERSRLRGLLAEEAARNGDFPSALALCRELFDKSPDGETARTLQRVAHLLTLFAADNDGQVFRDARATKGSRSSRITARIARLAAQALCVCDEDALEAALDAFKNYELLHTVFTQCDAGDYEALVARDSRSESSKVPADTAAASGSSGSLSYAMPSASTERRPEVSEPVMARDEMELANIGDRFSATLFSEYFRESSLVLSTQQAMRLACAFVLDTTAATPQNSALPGLQGESTTEVGTSGKGKHKSARGHPGYSGRLLAEYLIANKSLQTVLRVLQRAKEAVLRVGGTRETATWDSVIAFHFETLGRLLTAVMNSRTIDQRLAVGCLVSLPLKQAFDAYKAGMSSTGQEYARVLRIAGIGIAVATAWKQRSFRISCEDLAANAKWWYQLRLLGIPFDKDTFKYRTETGGNQRRIVPLLLARTGFDILTALEFARSYGIEDDFVIIEFVTGLVRTADEDSEYQSRVAGILDDAVNKERLLTALEGACLKRISSYDYERILFVSTQILRLKPTSEAARTAREVVGVLSDYGRTTKPSLEELQEAKRTLTGISGVSEQDTLAALLQEFPRSQQRLPFHALAVDPWHVLHAEMAEDAIPRLRPLRKALDLNLDQFYVVAIDNMFISLAAATGTPNTTSRLRFADVKRLVSHISDDTTAIDTLLGVAARFPCGTDRVSAYRMAFARAERLKPQAPGPDGHPIKRRAVEIREQLILTETEHQLRSLDMADMQQHIAVHDKMTSLMHNLYWSKSEVALDPRNDLDLHGVVNDIAKRNGVDADGFRTYLIGKWLAAEVPISEEEREMYLPSMRVQIHNGVNSRDEVAIQMRLLYLLRALPVADGIHYLLNFVTQPTSKIFTLNRVRALSVLFQLASPKELAKDGYEDIKNYMQMLLYLADFEELRIVISLKEFEKCDKKAFVRSLWVNHKDELKVVQLICNICLDYGVHDLSLWESALHRLLDKHVYRYLLGILEHLTSVSRLAQLRTLPQIWDGVLLGCLTLLADPQEPTTLAMQERVLTLVQKCPFVTEIQVERFVDHFAKAALQTPATFEDLLYALRGMAALPPAPGLAEAIEKTVSRLDSAELIMALDAMTGEHGVPGPHVEQGEQLQQQQQQRTCTFTATDTWIGKTWVTRAIYDRIDASGAYEHLLSTRTHHAAFVTHLIACDRAERLVRALVAAQRITGAADVVKQYYEAHPPTPEDIAPADLIQTFLDTHPA